MIRLPLRSTRTATLFPSTTLFRSRGRASGKRPECGRPAIAGKADKSLQRHASSRADGRERRLIWHLPSLRLCVSARTNFFLRAETPKRREKGWRLRRGEESCRHRPIAFALELAGEFCASGAPDARSEELRLGNEWVSTGET